jgi:hypothetical protein
VPAAFATATTVPATTAAATIAGRCIFHLDMLALPVGND